MKRLAILFSMLLMTVSMFGWVRMNDVFYDVDNVNAEATVVAGDTKYTGEVAIPEKFLWSGTNYTVVAIGENAFNGCTGLTKVYIPGTVKSIGRNAFLRCSSLRFVDFVSDGSGNYALTTIGYQAFAYCTSLAFCFNPIVDEHCFPPTLKTIEGSAFYGCTSLYIAYFQEGLTSIGNQAFASCTNLGSFYLPSTVTSIDEHAFNYCPSMELIAVSSDNVKYDSKFDGSNSANVIIERASRKVIVGCRTSVIPDDVWTIGSNAFTGCSSLEHITIPDNVMDIESSAFSYCTGLQSVRFGSSVQQIEFGAFFGCESLSTLLFQGRTAPKVGTNAFYQMPSSGTLLYPHGGTNYDTFSSSLPNAWEKFDSSKYLLYTTTDNNPLYIVNPQGAGMMIKDNQYYGSWGVITLNGIAGYIAFETFKNSMKLKTVVLPSALMSIGSQCFYNCPELTTIVLPETLTEIGNEAFANCVKLTSINLPSTLQTVGDNAFYYCCNITSIQSTRATAPILGNDVFDRFYDKGTLYVPDAAAYATWVAQLPDGWTVKPLCNVIEYDNSTGDAITLNFSGCFGANIVSHTFDNGHGVITFDGPVQFIGDCAFVTCTHMTSVTIPESVIYLGQWAFAFTRITDIDIPASVEYIDEGCFSYSSLQNVTLHEGLKYILPSSFSNCSDLTSVVIPASVKIVGEGAFQGDYKLTSLTVADGNTIYDSRGGCNAIISSFNSILVAGCSTTVIPEGVNSIAARAFYDMHLTDITIPSTIGRIENYAFCQNNLKSITWNGGNAPIFGDDVFQGVAKNGVLHASRYAETNEWLDRLNGWTLDPISYNTIEYTTTNKQAVDVYPSFGDQEPILNVYDAENNIGGIVLNGTVTTIGQNAFYQTSTLETITLPETLEAIDSYAFYRCSSLTSLNIPKNVSVVAPGACYVCTALTTVTVDEDNPIYDSRNGCNAVIETATGSLVLGCATTVIPAGVTQIDAYAFAAQLFLSSIDVPVGVNTIGVGAFSNCQSLTSLTLPETMTAVRPNAFTYSAINTLTMLATTPPEANDDIFSDYTGITLHVPAASLNAYKNHPIWGKFPTIVGATPAKQILDGTGAYKELDANDGVLAISDTFFGFEVESEAQIPTVTYSRTFGTTKWQSFYLPFEVAVADLEGKFDVAYVNNFVQYANSKGNVERSSIEIIPVTEGYLLPNTPYFIKAHQTSASPQIMTFHNVTLEPTARGEVSHVESAVSMADFYGTYNTIDRSVTVADHLFLVSGGDFKWLEQPVKCFRTYMKLTSKSPMFRIDPNAVIQIRVIGEDYDDDATGIINPAEDPTRVIYDLQGRRVDNPQTGGLYIVNGKKMRIE